jgi:hypothetical protein
MGSRGKSWPNRQRKNAQKHMPRLMDEYGGCCAYCNRPVIPDRSVEGVVKWSPTIVYVENGGVPRAILRATIDHFLPLSQGGTNAYENLKLCCVGCNLSRNRVYNSKAPHNMLCVDCGGKRESYRGNKRRCRKCHRRIQEAFKSGMKKEEQCSDEMEINGEIKI